MAIWFDLKKLGKTCSDSVVTIGNFDGVHRGHQQLIQEVVGRARSKQTRSVAITFDPHPAAVLGRTPPPLLMLPEDRVARLTELGIDDCVILSFTKELAHMEAEAFVKQELIDQLGMKSLFIGPSTHIGRNREGTPERLVSLVEKYGFELKVIAPMSEGESMVSSSRIRRDLVEGNVDSALEQLGRPFETRGQVVSGEALGRQMGTPTANLGPVPTLLPGKGVYATYMRVGQGLFPSVTNVGNRPTIGEHLPLTVETHVLDFTGELLAKEVTLLWIKRIRSEKKFASKEELVAQIQKDVEVTRAELQRWGGKEGNKSKHPK